MVGFFEKDCETCQCSAGPCADVNCPDNAACKAQTGSSGVGCFCKSGYTIGPSKKSCTRVGWDNVAWGQWGTCSKPCGGGVRYRYKSKPNGSGLESESEVCGASPCPGSQEDVSWTHLIYMSADNNLDPYLDADMAELAAATQIDHTKHSVVVLVDRVRGCSASDGAGTCLAGAAAKRWSSVHLIDYTGSDVDSAIIGAQPLELKLLPDGRFEVLKIHEEQDLDRWEYLRDFVARSLVAYPASHRMLELWNHGGGWLGFGGDYSHRPGDHMSTLDIARAIKQGIEAADGKRLDIIGFDACLMGSHEVVSSIAPFADYIIASSEEEPGTGWDYSRISTASDATAYAQAIIAGFGDSPAYLDCSYCSLTTIDTNLFAAFDEALAELVRALVSEMAATRGLVVKVARARAGATSLPAAKPDHASLVDIRSFLTELSTQLANSEVPHLLSLTASAIAALKKAHVLHIGSSGPLSIYFPISWKEQSVVGTATESYRRWNAVARFGSTLDWGVFLSAYLDSIGELRPYLPSPSGGVSVVGAGGTTRLSSPMPGPAFIPQDLHLGLAGSKYTMSNIAGDTVIAGHVQLGQQDLKRHMIWWLERNVAPVKNDRVEGSLDGVVFTIRQGNKACPLHARGLPLTGFELPNQRTFVSPVVYKQQGDGSLWVRAELEIKVDMYGRKPLFTLIGSDAANIELISEISRSETGTLTPVLYGTSIVDPGDTAQEYRCWSYFDWNEAADIEIHSGTWSDAVSTDTTAPPRLFAQLRYTSAAPQEHVSNAWINPSEHTITGYTDSKVQLAAVPVQAFSAVVVEQPQGGRNSKITWSAAKAPAGGSSPSWVTIDLVTQVEGQSVVDTLHEHHANTGSASWPEDVNINYHDPHQRVVRISCYYPSMSDTAQSAPFSLHNFVKWYEGPDEALVERAEEPRILIAHPFGNISLHFGSQVSIAWASRGIAADEQASVDIVLTRGAVPAENQSLAGDQQVIANDIPARSRSYLWTVPSAGLLESFDYRVIIMLSSNEHVYDQSPAFTILQRSSTLEFEDVKNVDISDSVVVTYQSQGMLVGSKPLIELRHRPTAAEKVAHSRFIAQIQAPQGPKGTRMNEQVATGTATWSAPSQSKVQAGSGYFFRAVWADKNGMRGHADSVDFAISVAATPTAVTQMGSPPDCSIAWTHTGSKGATMHEAQYQCTDARCHGTWLQHWSTPQMLSATSSAAKHTARVSGCKAGYEYAVRVRAVVERGFSAWSTPTAPFSVATPVAAPKGVSRPMLQWQAGSAALSVTWDPVATAAGYVLRIRCRRCQNMITLASNAAGAMCGPANCSYTTTGTVLPRGNEYVVQVQANNEAGPGAWSPDSLPALYLGTRRPGLPQNVQVSVNTNLIHLMWDAASSGAASMEYLIETKCRQPTNNQCTDWQPMEMTTKTEILIQLPQDGTTMQYRIRASDGSAWGAPVLATENASFVGASVVAGAAETETTTVDSDTVGNTETPEATESDSSTGLIIGVILAVVVVVGLVIGALVYVKTRQTSQPPSAGTRSATHANAAYSDYTDSGTDTLEMRQRVQSFSVPEDPATFDTLKRSNGGAVFVVNQAAGNAKYDTLPKKPENASSASTQGSSAYSSSTAATVSTYKPVTSGNSYGMEHKTAKPYGMGNMGTAADVPVAMHDAASAGAAQQADMPYDLASPGHPGTLANDDVPAYDLASAGGPAQTTLASYDLASPDDPGAPFYDEATATYYDATGAEVPPPAGKFSRKPSVYLGFEGKQAQNVSSI